MDIHSSKKVVGGVQFSRRGSSIAFVDNHEDRSIQCFNRQGSSTGSNPQVCNPPKLKSSRPAFFSTGRKATAASSRAISTWSDKRKAQRERRNTSSLQERVTVESSSRQEHRKDFETNIRQESMVNLELDPTNAGIRMVFPEPEVPQSSLFQGLSLNANEALGCCQVTSNSRTRRPRCPMTGPGNQGASSSSSVRYSIQPRNATHTIRHPPNHVNGTYRYGLRNLSCTSISDVIPTGCSSDVDQNTRMDALRKIYSDGENSSSRSKDTVRSLTGGNPDSGESSFARSKGTIKSLTAGNPDSHRSSLSDPSPSILECPLPQPTSRRTRNRFTSRDGIVSIRNQRSENRDSRARLSDHADDNTFLLPETVMFPLPSRTQFSIREAASASPSQYFSTNLSSISQYSSGQSGSTSGSSHNRQRADSEDTNMRAFHGSWVNRDSNQCFNMEGIAEVLLALERIEQDEVLTYEELMVLESNLFLGGISFHDQHRDMRMDIDNMSYEELLALQEKMGTVSTALTEEALSACLKRSIYTPILRSGIACVVDDVKCSICQEEYVVGDEVGKLRCDHRYHVTCIHQWLRLKNWCPVCKSSACQS